MLVTMLAQLEEKFQGMVECYRTQRTNLEAEIEKCDAEHTNAVPNCVKGEAITVSGLHVFHSVNGEQVKCTRCNRPSM